MAATENEIIRKKLLRAKNQSKTPLGTQDSLAKLNSRQHADHSSDLRRLKLIKGQIEGIETMITTGRYCPDILLQVKAATAALKAVELAIVQRHLSHCVTEAINNQNSADAQRKLQDIIKTLGR